MRQRHLARPHLALFSACFESLEKRSMLHAGHEHSADHVAGIEVALPQTANGDHIPATELLKFFPQLAGKDLWDASTFNPTGSGDRNDWLYDPHAVEDDITPASQLYPKPSGNAAEAAALPDLVPLLKNGSSNYLQPYIDTGEIPGHNLLRFSTAVGNMGAGPAILTSANSGTPPAGSGLTSWINPDGTQNVLQQLYSYNGTSYTFDSYRAAGKMVWHSGHGHFHLEGYANYRLLTRNSDGTAGPVAKRSGYDGSDAVGDKIGFCLINIDSSFTIPGTSTSSTTLPGYNRPGQPSTSCGFLQGIHTGKADVYDSIYDGQWIDVTGVPNGQYFLEVTLDASNVILESNEENNTVLVPYTLNAGNTSGGIQPDRFEPNNTPETATNLGELGLQTQPGLTVHVSNESDYFKFTAASSGPGSVRISVTNYDVNLYLYDANMNLLGVSASPNYGTVGSPAIENINHSFVAGQTYYARAAGFGTATGSGGISSGYSFSVQINPTVNASTPIAAGSEVGLTPGAFSIARNGPVSSPLTVNFTVGGTATRGVDYEIFQDGVPITGNTLTIGNEAAAANLEIRPIADSLVEPTETIVLTLGNGAYVIGGENVQTVTLADVPPSAIANVFTYETAHNLSFDFSLDVSASLDVSDLELLNTTTGETVAATTYRYDPKLNRVTFGFDAILPDGDYSATIARSSLTHSQGAPLAADAVASFFVLAGDINRDRQVGFDDLLALAQNYGAADRTFSQGNINYDAAGLVNFDDLLLLSQKYGTSLVTVAPVAAPTVRSTTKRRVADVLN